MNVLAAILVVTNLGFTAAYDTSVRQPVWASYDLEPREVVASDRRDFPFRADPRIPGSDASAEYRELAASYDRGHLVPAADLNWSTNALRESYYFSNVCPMATRLNRGRWADNEREIRELAASGTVHVLVYPVFDPYRTGEFHPPERFVKVAWGWFGTRRWEEWNR